MFRFTIRDVLWLTVVVGLCVVLYLQHAKHRHIVSTHQTLSDDLEFYLKRNHTLREQNQDYRSMYYEWAVWRSKYERPSEPNLRESASK